MATGTIEFTAGSAIFPDGSASNAAPALVRVKSSAAAPTSYTLELRFDATTEEQVCFNVPFWPADYASAPVAKVSYKMTSATTGGVAFESRIAAITAGDATDADAKAFAAANVGTDTVAGTAGYIKTVSFALTNDDSVAAGDHVSVYLNRDPAHASDTATGDCEVTGFAVTYTTA